MIIPKNDKRETRTFVVSELRAVAEDGKITKIVGHAAKFNSMSEDLCGFHEIIAPGAFSMTIKSADVRALWNHDSNIVLGRNKAGTLRLREDEEGLYFECDAPDNQLIRDMVLGPISRGDVTQCSFGFRTITDKWENKDGKVIRTLMDVELFDVSPVTYPAYQDTDVAVRSMQNAFKEVPSDTAWQIGLMRRRLALSA